MTQQTIEAILIDCGEVIWDDCPHNEMLIKELFLALDIEGAPVTEEALFAARKAAAAEGATSLYEAIIGRLIGADHPAAPKVFDRVMAWNRHMPFEQYTHLNPLRDGCREALVSLAERYTLAVVANQPPRAADLLKHYELHDYFAFVGISEEMNLFKPDPEFYRAVLSAIDTAPENAIMIGDRYINDIEPAHAVGMSTIRFECPSNRWLPTTGQLEADHTAHSWEEVVSVLQRTCAEE